MDLQDFHGFKIIHLTDGLQHEEAMKMINADKADGINFNYVTNRAEHLGFLIACPKIKYIQINDSTCDYSIINSLSNLEELLIYTDDRTEINFKNFPKLKRVAIYWRPKAKSLFTCSKLEHLFLGKYTEKDLSKLSGMSSLRYLRINTGSIQSLRGIEHLRELEELWLMLIPSIKSLDGLQHLSKLTKVYIDNCKNISDIKVLDMLPPRTSVTLAGKRTMGARLQNAENEICRLDP